MQKKNSQQILEKHSSHSHTVREIVSVNSKLLALGSLALTHVMQSCERGNAPHSYESAPGF